MTTNPNNCTTCGHKANRDAGHCYMFRDAPTDVCMQHTGRGEYLSLPFLDIFPDVIAVMLSRPIPVAEVTCLSCGARAATAEAIPCGH